MTENIKAISDFLFIEDDIKSIKKSDLVIVLCNDSINDLANKIDYLFCNNIINDNTKIIISGSNGLMDIGKEKECIRLLNKLNLDYGYGESLFTLEDEATNIYENLLFSKRYIDSFDDYDNIIIIGASFALRRIKMCACKLEYPCSKMQFIGTIDERNISKDSWWMDDIAKKRVFEEIERIGKYLLKGDLDIR